MESVRTATRRGRNGLLEARSLNKASDLPSICRVPVFKACSDICVTCMHAADFCLQAIPCGICSASPKDDPLGTAWPCQPPTAAGHWMLDLSLISILDPDDRVCN